MVELTPVLLLIFEFSPTLNILKILKIFVSYTHVSWTPHAIDIRPSSSERNLPLIPNPPNNALYPLK